jgi:peptidyl-prolyl cis-trans isomerase SurA
MRMIRQIAWLAAVVGAGCVPALACGAQQVVDRIVARVDEEIILQSDLEQLERYQTLVEGKPESREKILDRLIDQWIVRKEAEASRFPAASDSDVERGLQRLRRSFAKTEDFDAQREKAGLTETDVKQIVTAQAFLTNYLDSRFRPIVQVEEKAIRDFYDNALIPRAKARGQEPPSFDNARDVIQEVLIQRGINEQADKWLEESRARLHISKFLNEGGR